MADAPMNMGGADLERRAKMMKALAETNVKHQRYYMMYADQPGQREALVGVVVAWWDANAEACDKKHNKALQNKIEYLQTLFSQRL